jgi:hypothetical protein
LIAVYVILIRPEIGKRLATANRVYYALHPILKRFIWFIWKHKINKTLIRPIITYGAESWTMNSETGKLLAVFEREVLRKILGAIKNQQLLEKTT